MVLAHFDAFNLRTLDLSDADALKMLEPGDLSCSLGEWLFPPGGEMELLERTLREHAAGKSLWVGIFEGTMLIGVLGLCDIDHSTHSSELSYALGGPHRGRGIMTKACRSLVRFAFENLGLTNLQIRVDTANKPACALAERLGFKREQIICDAYQSAGVSRNVFQYSLSRPEQMTRTT